MAVAPWLATDFVMCRDAWVAVRFSIQAIFVPSSEGTGDKGEPPLPIA